MNSWEREVRKEIDEVKAKIKDTEAEVKEKLSLIEELKNKEDRLFKHLSYVERCSTYHVVFDCFDFIDPTSAFLNKLKNTDELSLDVALFILGVNYDLFKNRTTRAKSTVKYNRYIEPNNVEYRMTVAKMKSLIKPVNPRMKICLIYLLTFCYKCGLNLDRFTPIGELGLPLVDTHFSDFKDLTVSDLIIKGLGREGFFKSWEDLDSGNTNRIFGTMRIPYQVSCYDMVERDFEDGMKPEYNVGYYHSITKCRFLSREIPVYKGD